MLFSSLCLQIFIFYFGIYRIKSICIFLARHQAIKTKHSTGQSTPSGSGLHVHLACVAGGIRGHERWPSQSRSQSMPVRGLCCGMTLWKSNRNRDLIGCRDHQCCRHINACFLRELRGNIREERIINVYQIWNAKSNNINRRI